MEVEIRNLQGVGEARIAVVSPVGDPAKVLATFVCEAGSGDQLDAAADWAYLNGHSVRAWGV